MNDSDDFRKPEGSTRRSIMNSPWISIVGAAVLGMLWLWAIIDLDFGLGLGSEYGLAVFVGLPLVVGTLSAFWHGRGREVTIRSSIGHACAAIGLVAILALTVAFEGALCIIMAAPLYIPLTILGALLGHASARESASQALERRGMLLIFLPPLLLAYDHSPLADPPMRQVTTSVLVDAPIEKVWDIVIAFPPIEEAPSGILATGIAYPISAGIEGQGVGALRRCRFSTGDFVEPITTWDEPHLLAFDVTENPEPMRELSLWSHVDAPHLHGFMVSDHGQFRLVEQDGKVLLEGTTWYRHDLAPQAYWGAISDQIIHAIHRRVLEHIKRVAEAR